MKHLIELQKRSTFVWVLTALVLLTITEVGCKEDNPVETDGDADGDSDGDADADYQGAYYLEFLFEAEVITRCMCECEVMDDECVYQCELEMEANITDDQFACMNTTYEAHESNLEPTYACYARAFDSWGECMNTEPLCNLTTCDAAMTQDQAQCTGAPGTSEADFWSDVESSCDGLVRPLF